MRPLLCSRIWVNTLFQLGLPAMVRDFKPVTRSRFSLKRKKIYQGPIYTLGVHQLQQIFCHLAITQTRIKVSSWNFQHLFIMCLCKFDKKILAITETACQPWPILAKTLNASSDCICWDILKRKKTGEALDHI